MRASILALSSLGILGLVAACGNAGPGESSGEATAGATAEADGPDCSDDGKKERVKKEADLYQKLVKNKCLPNNFGEDPCKTLYADWKALKADNATCNAKAANQTLCDYYKSMVKKYEGLIKDYCSPPKEVKGKWPPANMMPTTAQAACDYAQASLDLFNQGVKDNCNDGDAGKDSSADSGAAPAPDTGVVAVSHALSYPGGGYATDCTTQGDGAPCLALDATGVPLVNANGSFVSGGCSGGSCAAVVGVIGCGGQAEGAACTAVDSAGDPLLDADGNLVAGTCSGGACAPPHGITECTSEPDGRACALFDLASEAPLVDENGSPIDGACAGGVCAPTVTAIHCGANGASCTFVDSTGAPFLDGDGNAICGTCAGGSCGGDVTDCGGQADGTSCVVVASGIDQHSGECSAGACLPTGELDD